MKQIILLIVLIAFCMTASINAQNEPATSEKVLMTADFERDQTGKTPRGWYVAVDKGNSVEVVDDLPDSTQCLKFTDVSGSQWKPFVSGYVKNPSDKPLRLDFDWRINQKFASGKQALSVMIRGYGNIALVNVCIGGGDTLVIPLGGSAPPIKLDVPILVDQWNAMSIIMDPVKMGDKGTYTIIIKQGENTLMFPNIQFSSNWYKQYPTQLWMSPAFSLGQRGIAGEGAFAWIDNVRLLALDEERNE